MSTETPAVLTGFAEWIRQTDAHAAHHLRLAEAADAALEGAAGSGQRAALADKLERWRYQLLNERAGRMRPQDEHLADALDLTARRLAGWKPERPRAARRAIRDAAWDPPQADDAMAALDPARPWEAAAERARRITNEHFQLRDGQGRTLGRRMLLYAPLYVSSHCVNYCRYCGFRYPNPIERRHLTLDEARQQLEILMARGHRRILIVGGDFPSRTGVDYYAAIIGLAAGAGAVPTIEIAPQSTSGYRRLVEAGARGLTLYQETYDEALYAEHHPRGPKASYCWRLEAHERAGEAGMPRLGLGVLLGLADPAADLLAMMRHARYLQDRFPRATLAFSLPRIHEAPEGFTPPYQVSDELLIRLYCALRIAFPQAELVLSTREPAALRDRLASICITQMSAGSSTAPGGYAPAEHAAGQQFPVADRRSPAEVAQRLAEQGFQVRWA